MGGDVCSGSRKVSLTAVGQGVGGSRPGSQEPAGARKEIGEVMQEAGATRSRDDQKTQSAALPGGREETTGRLWLSSLVGVVSPLGTESLGGEGMGLGVMAMTSDLARLGAKGDAGSTERPGRAQIGNHLPPRPWKPGGREEGDCDQ